MSSRRDLLSRGVPFGAGKLASQEGTIWVLVSENDRGAGNTAVRYYIPKYDEQDGRAGSV